MLVKLQKNKQLQYVLKNNQRISLFIDRYDLFGFTIRDDITFSNISISTVIDTKQIYDYIFSNRENILDKRFENASDNIDRIWK